MRRTWEPGFGQIALVAGTLSILSATGALVGWVAEWEMLVRYRAGWPAMPPAMAIGLLGCGIAALSDGLGRWRRLGLCAAGVAAVMGLLGVLGLDLVPARWIARQPVAEVRALPTPTASCLLLAGCSLFLLRCYAERVVRAPLLFWISGVVLSCMAGAALVTQLIGVGLYYADWSPLTGMAVPTAVSLLALGLAVLTHQGRSPVVARSHASWAGIAVGAGTALAVLALWTVLVGEERRHIARTADQALSSVRFHVARDVGERLQNLVRMAERWAVGRDPLREEWEADAELNVFHNPGVEALAWIDPAGVPRLLVTTPGSAIDADLLAQRFRVDRPPHDGRARIASSFPIGERRAVSLYAPILEGDRYRGTLAAVLRTDAALAPALQDAWDRYEIEIRDAGEALVRVVRDQEKPRLAVEAPLELTGATWRVRIWPRAVWLTELQSEAVELALGVGLALAILAGTTVSLARTAGHRLRSVHGLLESAPDAMVVVDDEGRILLVNRETERLFGIERHALVGSRVDRLVPDWPESLTGPAKASTGGSSRPLEVHAWRGDGTAFPAEIVLSPIASERGPLVSGAIRDLTGRRDEELRRRLAAIVTTSGDAILGTRIDGTIVDWNPGAERNYGWTAAEVIGRHISVLEPEEVAGEMAALLTRVRSGAVVAQHETVRRRKDGERIDVSLTVSPIRGPDGEVVGASSIGRDVRELKRTREALRAQRDALSAANAELARSNADLDAFAAVASHDLRAPLRGIASLAAWIAEDHAEALGEEGGHQLALLQDRAERMQRLVEGVLAYSRSGRKHEAARLDSRELMVEVLAAMPPHEGVEVSVGELPSVVYDETQLTQVLQNLVSNAMQHLGRERGRIEVSAREGDGCFEFCVADDGVGIPEQHRERVFQLFKTLSHEGGSSGVGLAVVKKIVEANGGRVWIADRAGGGTEFWFSVPT